MADRERGWVFFVLVPEETSPQREAGLKTQGENRRRRRAKKGGEGEKGGAF